MKAPAAPLKVPDQIEIYWGGKWYPFPTVEAARAAGFDLSAPAKPEAAKDGN